MSQQKIKISIFLLLLMIGIGCDGSYAMQTTQQVEDSNTAEVDLVLQKINDQTLEMVSYESQIEFKFKQPLLWNSQDLRKGILYYIKEGNKPKLRVNFQTRKQDEEEEQEYIEQWIILDGQSLSSTEHHFEGNWLVHIDYETEEFRYYQLAEPNEPNEPNEPVNVFDLISKYIPIVGFSKIEELKKQFDVSLIDQDVNEPVDSTQIYFKVKQDSIYQGDYTDIYCWIDKDINLPVKIVATTTEGDIYEIQFLNAELNKDLDENVFDFKISENLGEPEITPLKNSIDISN